MKAEIYQLTSENSFAVFEFTSEGPKGLIRKRIEFQRTRNPQLFNLAFGDKNPDTGEIDDTVVSNNSDSEKVLATVVSSCMLFLINIQTRLYMRKEVQRQEQDFTGWALPDFMKR